VKTTNRRDGLHDDCTYSEKITRTTKTPETGKKSFVAAYMERGGREKQRGETRPGLGEGGDTKKNENAGLIH